jgi:protein-tyrosine phosphatase
MIDLHCHILPGIDDGPPTIEEALDLARAAVAGGTSTIVATPHVNTRYPNDAATIAAAVSAVNERLREEQIPLDVRAGAELAFTQIDALAEGELDRLRLGDGPWLLIESPYTLAVDSLPTLLARLQSAGHRIVLAHPERCPGFQRRPELLGTLAAQGVINSVTAGALVGRFGRVVQRFALAMAQDGLIHNVASDAHDCDRRPPGIGAEMERAGLGAHIRLLAAEVPEAIVSGGELPPHPGALLAPQSARRRWWRRGLTRA